MDKQIISASHNGSAHIYPLSKGALIFSILAAFVAAFGSLFLAQNLLHRPPAYPDFIVGAITWDAASKFQDITSYPAFILGFLVGGWVTYRLFMRVSNTRSQEYEQSLITTLIWWLVPVGIGIGGFLSIYPSASSFFILVGVAGAVITALMVRLHLSYGEMMPQQIGIGVLAIMLLGLLPYGVATIQDRLPMLGEALRFGAAPKVGALLIITTTLYLLYLYRSSSTAISQYIQKILLIAQLGIAPFYLLILPDLYITDIGEPAIQTTVWLWVLSFVLVVATIVDVIVRYKKFVYIRSTDLSLLLSPIAIFTTIVLFRNAVTVVPNLPTDDYHFGESLLSWWSFIEFGKMPYLDFIPPHGIFGDDIGGFLSLIFYDGTAATLAEADRLAATLTMFVAFMALRIYTGSLGLAYVSILLFGIVSRKLFFLILVPFFCLWLKVSNLKPQIWLWIWLISSIVLVLLVPPQGLIAVIASLPAVALYLYRARYVDWKRVVFQLALLAGVLALFTPIPAMLHGAIRYVLENGPVNQIAYGLPWSWSWGVDTQDKGKAMFVAGLEVLRMSWVWVPLIAAVVIVVMFGQRERRAYLIGVALPVLLFASLLTPYSMGRIDPAAMSRPGLISSFAWAALLPILLSPLIASRGRAVLAVGIAFVCAGIGLASVNKGGLSSVLEKNQVSNLWSGADHGLRNMGTGLVQPQHVNRLERINKYLSSRLAPRETYLDLSGHNADYMYFDRPPPMPTSAPYNMALIKEQQRAVARLSRVPPRIALLEGDNINHDGVGLSLRAHLLYRFILKHYTVELHDGYVYGVKKGTKLSSNGISFSVRQLTDSNWHNGIHRTENAIAIRDLLTVRYIQIGDVIILPDDTTRTVTRVWQEGNAIWFDGSSLLQQKAFVNEREIQIVLSDSRKLQLTDKLMELLYSVPDLRKVPVAWGQSVSSLSAVMSNIANLDFSLASLHDVISVGDVYRVVGSDPYIWLDLSKLNIAGETAGLLKFDLKCEGAQNPRVQVFWWGDDMQGADPSRSLIFTATNGSVIIPLDAYPSWLNMSHVNGLRIDIDSSNTCQTFAVKRASLNQRANLSEQSNGF